MKKLHKRQDGFTVIELLVFILVLTTIAVIGVSTIRSAGQYASLLLFDVLTIWLFKVVPIVSENIFAIEL